MKKLVLLATVTWAVIVVNAQTKFAKTYGGSGDEYGYSVLQTNDNGYIIAGYTTSFGAGGRDVWLIKTDANGDTLWTKTYGGTGSDEARSIQQTNDNGYIIAGGTRNFGAGGWDVWLIKTDANGDTLWTKTYGGSDNEQAYSVQQTYDNGYIIAGSTKSFGAGWEDIYLIKTDENGDTLWTKTFGGVVQDFGYSVQQTIDTGYIVTGYAQSFFQGMFYLLKTDANGNALWTKYFGNNYPEGRSVLQTNDNGYIVVGRTKITGNTEVYLIKTNSIGDTLWTKTYGGLDIDEGLSLQQTNDNGYIIAGATGSFGAGHYDYYLIKTDANGDTLWTRTFGKTSLDYAYSVKQTSDNGYVIVGRKLVWLAGTSDIYMVKTDSLGNSIALGTVEYYGGQETEVRVYPNPARDELTIQLAVGPDSYREQYATFELYDVMGRRVKQLTINKEQLTIDVSELPAGLYIWSIGIARGKVVVDN